MFVDQIPFDRNKVKPTEMQRRGKGRAVAGATLFLWSLFIPLFSPPPTIHQATGNSRAQATAQSNLVSRLSSLHLKQG